MAAQPDTTSKQATSIPAERPAVEEWRGVVGYEGTYDVSSWGRVRRTERASAPGSGILSAFTGRGRPTVVLHQNGAARTVRTSTLVAAAFGEPRPEGYVVVAHLDGIPTHDYPANLAYATRKENAEHAEVHGTRARGSRMGNAKLTEEQVLDILLNPESAANLGRKYGVSPVWVRTIRRGEMWAWLRPDIPRRPKRAYRVKRPL